MSTRARRSGQKLLERFTPASAAVFFTSLALQKALAI